MTEQLKDFLRKLNHINPDRFDVFEDAEGCGELWSFYDNHIQIGISDDKRSNLYYWLLAALSETHIISLDRIDTMNWEQSMLTAIVRWHQEFANKTGYPDRPELDGRYKEEAP